MVVIIKAILIFSVFGNIIFQLYKIYKTKKKLSDKNKAFVNKKIIIIAIDMIIIFAISVIS